MTRFHYHPFPCDIYLNRLSIDNGTGPIAQCMIRLNLFVNRVNAVCYYMALYLQNSSL